MNKRRLIINAGLIILFLFAAFFTARKGVDFLTTSSETAKQTIVLDPGHGGRDPGKVGVNGVEEKELNLQISFYLKEFLESKGYHVVMTRETDIGLYSESASNKKREDMNNRIAIINEANAVAAVGIHQNSFTESQYKGAQTFYYNTSEEGAKLGIAIQEQLIAGVDPENSRVAKGNNDYFLLKNSAIPMVIVESGFLSNQEECELLCDDEYQQKLAENIGLGIINYLNAQ